MIYLAAGALAGGLLVAVVALIVMSQAHERLMIEIAEMRVEARTERHALLVRIQAPDSPQVAMMPDTPAGARRKLWVSEADEIEAGLRRAEELIAQA